MTEKKMTHRMEACGIGLFYYLVKCLPLSWSRGFFAFLARTIGPLLKVSNVGRENFYHAFPEKSPLEIESILRSCWDNLGRIVGEFPHIANILSDQDRFEVSGASVLNTLKDKKKAAIFITAHMGNWEIAYAPFLYTNLDINLIARQHRNPFIEKLLMRDRLQQGISIISRNQKGSRELLKAIKNKELIGAIVDQYATDGVFLPFFNRPARTTLALARLAVKHDLHFVPVQVVRIGKASRFKIIFHPPLEPNPDKSPQENSVEMMTQTNALMEGWIKEHPGQWLWLHKRWKVKRKQPRK